MCNHEKNFKLLLGWYEHNLRINFYKIIKSLLIKHEQKDPEEIAKDNSMNARSSSQQIANLGTSR